MPLAPYWKIIIPGLAIAGEGGSLLFASFLLGFLGNMTPLGSEIFSSGPGQFLGGMGFIYFWIGVISLIVGIPILIVGLIKRSQYNSGNYY